MNDNENSSIQNPPKAGELPQGIKKKNRFQELDSLRGFAALIVVFFHYTMGREEANWGFKLGNTGVDLFFIISGFVILLSLSKIKKSGQFIINRVSRLYPTYWASVSTTFLMIVLYGIYKTDFSQVDLVQYLGNMTMFQFYLRIPNLDGPYWTMIIEMLFYIFMLLLFHFKLMKHLNKIGVFITVAMIPLMHFSQENEWLSMIHRAVPLLKYWPLFFAGILFYKLLTQSNDRSKHIALIVLCLISEIIIFTYTGRVKFIDVQEYSFMLICYFALFMLFVFGKLKFIVNKPALFLGKISFALYLIHQKISIGIIIPTLMQELGMNFWFASLIALICSIAIASAITYFIEVPYSSKMKTKLYEKFLGNN